jgi:hypothetical protein
VIGVIRGHMATDHRALLDRVSTDDLRSWIHRSSASAWTSPKRCARSRAKVASSRW